ncbi:Large ribosomal subunit protein eL37-like protein [Drosera capensis]
MRNEVDNGPADTDGEAQWASGPIIQWGSAFPPNNDRFRVRGRGVLGRGGTRRTRSVSDAGVGVFISRRVVVPLVGSPRHARGNNWSVKAISRNTTGTGRLRFLRHVPRRFKTNFPEGTQAAPKKHGASTSG